MASFINQSNQAHASTTRLTTALQTFRAAAIAGFATTGIAMSTFVAHGVNEAAKFERAMVTVGVATGTTGSALTRMQNQVAQISSQTAQSATTIAEEFSMLGRAGFSSQQVSTLMPEFAKYADVQMLSHGTDPVDAIRTAAQIAHQEGAYTVETVRPMLELLNKLSFMNPEDMRKVATQGKYFIPAARTLGMSEEDTVRYSALLGITGYMSGKGGTSLAGAILGGLQSTQVTAHLQKAKAIAESRLGLIDPHTGQAAFFDRKHNKLMLTEMFQHLQKEQQAYIKSGRGTDSFFQDLQAVFMRGPAQFILTAIRKETVDQMAELDKKMKQIPSIDKTFGQYISTFSGLTNMLATNFTNLFIAVFLPVLKYIEPYIRRFSDYIGDLGQYFRDHPDLGLKIATGAIVLAAGSFAAAAALSISYIGRLTGAIIALGVAANASATASGAGAVAGAVGAAGGRAGLLGRVWAWASGASFFSMLGGGLGNFWGQHIGPHVAGSAGSIGRARPGMFGVNWAVRGLGGGIQHLLHTHAPWLFDALDAALGVAGIPGKRMGRAGLGGVNWAMRGVGGGISQLMHNWTGSSNGFAALFGRIFQTLERSLPVLGRFSFLIGEFGLKFIPVIGWISLAIDGFNLFKKHGTDFAWVLGKIVGFMQYKFWPALVTDIEIGWTKVAAAATDMFSRLWKLIVTLFTNPRAVLEGGGQWWQNNVNAFLAGQSTENNVSPAAGRMRKPDKQTTQVFQTFTLNVTGDPKDKDLHKKVAAEIVRRSPFLMRAGGGTSGTARIPELQFAGTD